MTETHTSLLRRVRDPADSKSWGEFVKLYEPLLLSYVRKHGLNHADAEDVVQNILVSLLRALPTFDLDRQRGRFRTWLWQITSNAVTDWGRKQRRINRAEGEWWTRQEKDTQVDKPDDDWNQAHRRRVMEFVLERVREQTAPKTWACFEQHLLKGRAGTEVGRELELSANTVYVNASRVLARVREQCTAYLEELGDE